MKRTIIILFLTFAAAFAGEAQRVGKGNIPSSLRPTPDKWAEPTGAYDVVMEVYAVREIPGDSHAGTFREKNGGAYSKVAVDWLDWHLKGDNGAKATFVGKKASLKTDPKWIDLKVKNVK